MKNAITVGDISELKQVLMLWVKEFSKQQVILLNGPMGVGKTQCVHLLCEILGADVPSSPSFAIHNRYEGGNVCIDHLDLYRIESDEDLESTGFWDLFHQPQGLVVIEWAEKIMPLKLSKKWKIDSVELSFVDGVSTTQRRLDFTPLSPLCL